MKNQMSLKKDFMKLLLVAIIISCGVCTYGQNNKRSMKKQPKVEQVNLTIKVPNKMLNTIENIKDINSPEEIQEEEIVLESWMIEPFPTKNIPEEEFILEEDISIKMEKWMLDPNSWKVD